MYSIEVSVLRKEGRRVTVAFFREKMCGCCPGVFCSVPGHSLGLDTDLDLEPGDRVRLGLDSKWMVLLSVFTFLLPSLLFVFVLYIFRNRPDLGLPQALSGLILYFLYFKYCLVKRIAGRIKPRILL